ncbi:polysaccharide biosynthesis/export family protein [Aestuariibius sp. HNIBRBA575]|uniref:polysaccharide biosynthesis/export family protein n=1 Tax=Aestuariibius sp. HNIBRBA575 TaxID=3233343 RepID=UPI0034A4C6EE
MRHLTVLGLVLAMSGALSACGNLYRSPVVDAGVTEDTALRVVALNGETVSLANRAPYAPRTLPALFSQTAGYGSGLRGAGALPTPPVTTAPAPGRLSLSVPQTPAIGPYHIGVGDVVLLATPSGGSSVEQLSGLLAAQNSRQGYTVQDDGAIHIPNVGRIVIAGSTLEEAEATLFESLISAQIDPTFSLEIAEFNSQRITVGGAVARPMAVPLQLTPLVLSEALVAAGGAALTDESYASIRIYRDGQLYQIPMEDFRTRPDLQRLRLVDGDSIFVDTTYELNDAQDYFAQQITLVELRQRSRQAALTELQTEVNLRRAELAEGRQNYLTRMELGAVERDYVYLTGEVGQQSRYALPYGQQASLADALFDGANGVPTRTGDVSQIYVLRASSDPRDFGAVTAWHLDARNAANLTLAARFELRPDDVIFVAEQPVTRWNRVIQQITPSLITSGVTAATR